MLGPEIRQTSSSRSSIGTATSRGRWPRDPQLGGDTHDFGEYFSFTWCHRNRTHLAGCGVTFHTVRWVVKFETHVDRRDELPRTRACARSADLLDDECVDSGSHASTAL